MRWGERASERARKERRRSFQSSFLGRGRKRWKSDLRFIITFSLSLCRCTSEGTSAIFYLKRMRCHFFQFFPEVHSSRFLHHLSGIHSGGRKEGREVKRRGRRRGIGRRRSGSWSDIARKSSFFWSTKEVLCRGGEIWLEFQFSTAFFPSRLRHRHCRRRQCPTKSAIANMTQKVGTTVGCLVYKVYHWATFHLAHLVVFEILINSPENKPKCFAAGKIIDVGLAF